MAAPRGGTWISALVWTSRRGALVASVLALMLCLAVPGAAGASGSGWSVTPTPNVPAPTGSGYAESCLRGGPCIAVGSYVSRSGIGRTLAERWNGRRWRIQPTPNPAAARVSALNAVSCSSASRCIAVGDWFGESGIQRPLFERWNGTAWMLGPIPNPANGRQNPLYAVSCASAHACEAVGQSFGPAGDSVPIAERWDGREWHVQAIPSPAGAGYSYLFNVACVSAANCVAVGAGDASTLIERWNGTRWTIESSPNASGAGFSFLNGIACTSSLACTAVGGSDVGALAERWDGTRWSATTTPAPAGAQFSLLNGVACMTRFACEAVGGYVNSAGAFVSMAAATRGRAWTLRTTHDPPGTSGNSLNAVACTSVSGCIAIGMADGDQTPRVMAQRLAGGSWQLARIANPTGAAETAFGGVSCPASDRCIAVGSGGNAMSQRWNGRSWRMLPTASPSDATGSQLGGVSCVSMDSCFAAGQYQTTEGSSLPLSERWNGGRWSVVAIPNPGRKTQSGLGGISCTSRLFCMAAGAAGNDPTGNGPVAPLAEMWNGHAWTITPTRQSPGAVQTFLGPISCTSPSACTTTGEQHFADGSVTTIAERWDGTRWTIQPTPNPAGVNFASLGGVTCTSSTHCVAVGGSDNGTLAERWNGTRWTIMQTPQPPGGGPFTGFGFTAVACSSASACTAVGYTSQFAGMSIFAERWDGHTWQLQPTPIIPGSHDISTPGVACPTSLECVSVGGYENDGPGSVTIAEVWNGADTISHSASAATSSQFRPATTCNPQLLLRLSDTQLCANLNHHSP